MSGFLTSIFICFALEISNCLFPYYAENMLTEKEHGYHENIGCICAWEKEDFIYNEETGKWDISPDASRKRDKGKGKRKRGGRGLR